MKTVMKLLFVMAFCYSASAQTGSKQACDADQSHESDVTTNVSRVCVSAASKAAARTKATSICKQKIQKDNGNTIKASAGDVFGCRGCLKNEVGCEMQIASLKSSKRYKAQGNPTGTADSTNPDHKIYCFTCPGGEWKVKFSCTGCVDTLVHQDTLAIVMFKYDEGGNIVYLDGRPLKQSTITDLYPNPTSGIINVQFLSIRDYESIDIVITDMRGQIVWRGASDPLSHGENMISVNAYNLAQGPHLISLFKNGERIDTRSVSIIN